VRPKTEDRRPKTEDGRWKMGLPAETQRRRDVGCGRLKMEEERRKTEDVSLREKMKLTMVVS
jgi:hypothetical protein